MDGADTEAFIKERNEMLRSLDLDRAMAFHRKYYPDSPVPERAIVEVALHKARTAALSLSDEERELSERWLAARGYTSLS